MKAHHNGHEHEFEPEYGLPEKLPQDERILWQGSPETGLVFRHVFHARGLAIYFLLILIARAGQQYSESGSAAQAVAAALWLVPVFALGLLLFWAMAYLVAKTTVYTLTSFTTKFLSHLYCEWHPILFFFNACTCCST